MILLDSDVMIDLLGQYPPAVEWFDTLEDEERGTFVQNVHNAPTAEHLNIHNQFLYLV
jgi:predicted nucleic acid-binding protein